MKKKIQKIAKKTAKKSEKKKSQKKSKNNEAKTKKSSVRKISNPKNKKTTKPKSKKIQAKSKIKKEKEIISAKVTHYFDKIKVAVLKVRKPIKIGDELKFIGPNNQSFRQKITSLQINHEKVKQVGKGKSAGLKVKKTAKENWLVFRIAK